MSSSSVGVPEPVAQESEIAAAAWVPLEEYKAMVWGSSDGDEKDKGHPMMKCIMNLVAQDWNENDIQRTVVPSVVPGRQPSPIYHAPLRSSSSSQKKKDP